MVSSVAMLLLSIVKLDHSINQLNDPPVIDTVNKVIDHLSCITPNNNGILSSTSTTDDDDNELRAKATKSIIRYHRNIDKWTSFTSLLLKSIAYYRSLLDHDIGITSSLKSEDDDDPTHHMNKLQINVDEKRPIVDLPRTEYNRPYIPIQILLDEDTAVLSSSSCCSSTKDTIANDKVTNENYNSMMNISHQYPWVCMVQKQQLSPSFTTTVVIGLDIVIFDPHINDYTPTITNFLSNFESSFTPFEWDRITNYNNHLTTTSSSRLLFGKKQKQSRSEQSQLQEFYLRWSIKESYTKALGIGMNINFHEFETILIGIDNNDNDDDDEGGIWSTIMRQDDIKTTNDTTTRRRKIGDIQLSIIGKVKHIKSPSSKPHCEYWEFIFIPLDHDSDSESSNVDTTSVSDVWYDGCACICRGPVAKDDIKSTGSIKDTTKKKVVSIEELTLIDLIELHGSNPL